ncbi:MAG: hypothetical protein NVS9B9_25770 [Ktedonobacteraceae bacterium]
MANRKKKTTTQLGKQPPRYRFFLNPTLHDFKEVVTFKLTSES